MYFFPIMGIIYLLDTKLLTEENEHVYKIGRSDQHGLKRIQNYPKTYEIILVIGCKDSIKVETELIKLFNQKYKKEVGNEYFSGNKHQMMNDIYNRIYEEQKMSLLHSIGERKGTSFKEQLEKEVEIAQQEKERKEQPTRELDEVPSPTMYIPIEETLPEVMTDVGKIKNERISEVEWTSKVNEIMRLFKN